MAKPLVILQKDSPVLRQVAKPVPLKDIGKDKLNELIDGMKSVLAQENDGVGLAAPQVGVSLRLFIVSELVFLRKKSDMTPEEQKTASSLEHANLVYINPEIITISKDRKALDEGCLSVRPLFGKVRRATRVKIRAYDEFGNPFERTETGLLAHIYQHEVDHLNGVLFVDKAKEIKEMPADPANPTTAAIDLK